MKFKIGTIPKDNKFNPKEEEWISLKEPNATMYQFFAFPLGFLSSFLIYRLINLSLDFLFTDIIHYLFLLLFIIFLHEGFHAICHPNLGFTNNTYVGIWPEKMLFYTHYVGKLKRNRYLFLFLNPFICLSVIPTVIIMSFDLPILIKLMVGKTAIINAFISCGDLFGFLLFVYQVPRNAEIKNKGWKSYWRFLDSVEKK